MIDVCGAAGWWSSVVVVVVVGGCYYHQQCCNDGHRNWKFQIFINKYTYREQFIKVT